MLAKIWDNITKYYFLGSALVIAILYYMFQRRGMKIKELQHEVIFNKIKTKRLDVIEKSKRSKKEYETAKASYLKLRDIYRDKYSSSRDKPSTSVTK